MDWPRYFLIIYPIIAAGYLVTQVELLKAKHLHSSVFTRSCSHFDPKPTHFCAFTMTNTIEIKNAFSVLTPETLRKYQIYAKLREEEVPTQENRAGLESISTTWFYLMHLLWFLLKSQPLPSYIKLSFSRWQDWNRLCKIWYYFGSLFQGKLHFIFAKLKEAE